MAKGDKDRELLRLQSMLYSALAAEFGLIVRTDDPKRARQRLYEARAACGDPSLARLQFRFSPENSDFIIIAKGPAPLAQEFPGLTVPSPDRG